MSHVTNGLTEVMMTTSLLSPWAIDFKN